MSQTASLPKRAKSRTRARAPKGTGSVYWCKRRKRYVAKKPIGRRNGRTLYRERTGRTEAEAIRRRDESLPPPPSVTVAEWFTRWLASAKGRPQSHDEYRVCLKHRIGPALGHIPLAKLTAFDVGEAVKAWAFDVGAATIRKTLAALSSSLQAAAAADLVTRNVARAVRPPKAPGAKIDPFTPGELLAVIEAAATRPDWRIFGACAATGCRIGEAMSLGSDSYNAATGMLTISRTKTRRHGEGPPKSEKSARTISVPIVARALFAAGIPRTNHTTAYGRWEKMLADLNIRHRNPHQLKHSVASHLVAAGVPLADAAAYLGDTLAVFVRTYVHPVNCNLRESLDRIFEESDGSRKASIRRQGGEELPRKTGKRRRAS